PGGVGWSPRAAVPPRLASARPGREALVSPVAEVLRMSCRNAGVRLEAVVAWWRRRWAPPWRTALRLAAGLTLVVAGCATPIRVTRVAPLEVERQLDSNVIATQHLSEATRIVLHRTHLLAHFATDPDGAIASLHRTLAAEPAAPDVLFALAEMSFLQ